MSIRLPHGFLLGVILVSLLFPLGSSDASSDSTSNGTKAGTPDKPRGHGSVPVVVFILLCVAAAAVVLLSLFLYQLWQRKKRALQHARLLKLFEEDDDLDELGLRD
ncbi:hypothetical protein MLD38_032214 [Melastoma candidum]|uniref:Uncharacterized protein n=1 Tax=Melastoma candidum TaxID=119954 RepID=A0ACB9M384_9MYRT|nr:hypothetical protein MLD38_032214 [Melastoma candidum]